MFGDFSEVRIKRENFDDFALTLAGKTLVISRDVFLNNLSRA